MKRHPFLLVPAVGAFLAMSAAAFAATQPSPASLANQSCKTQQAQLGATFKTTYGTKTMANAFGKCVSKATPTAQAAVQNAARTCKTEQSQAPADFQAAHQGQTFDQFYGESNAKGKGADANAYGKCVSTKAKAAVQQQTQATVSAAKACKAELAASKANFAAAYGTKPNAFGVCVSKKASSK